MCASITATMSRMMSLGLLYKLSYMCSGEEGGSQRIIMQTVNEMKHILLDASINDNKLDILRISF